MNLIYQNIKLLLLHVVMCETLVEVPIGIPMHTNPYIIWHLLNVEGWGQNKSKRKKYSLRPSMYPPQDGRYKLSDFKGIRVELL